jgi:hypothetical protein
MGLDKSARHHVSAGREYDPIGSPIACLSVYLHQPATSPRSRFVTPSRARWLNLRFARDSGTILRALMIGCEPGHFPGQS